MCADFDDLMFNLGPGFPLFFKFIKYLGFISFILTIIYFIPCAILVASAYRKIVEEDPEAKVLAVYSFGAFVKQGEEGDTTWVDVDYAEYGTRITIMLALVCLSVLTFLIFLIWMRRRLRNYA